MHGSFEEFTTRTAKIIPIALALIRTQTTNVSDKMKFLFDFNLNWLPSVWNSQLHINENLKSSLSPEEYQNMLNHINVYIETIINKKIQTIESERLKREESIDPKLALFIAKIVNEQIIEHKYTLTDADIERIAEIVRIKLAAELKMKPFILSQQNLEEISKIVKQNIEIHRHEWTIAVQNSKQSASDSKINIDIDEILYKILNSEKLRTFVEEKIAPHGTQLSDHQQSIEQLQNDVNNLKAEVQTIFSINDEAKLSLEDLKIYQNELSDRITSVQNENNEKLTKFLKEIDVKLNSFSETQFNAIDNHIRTVLVEILGYKSSDGKTLENVDITNWIRSLFVAKDLLETRLTELNEKFENRITDEINQSAGVLIKDISQKIKHDIEIAIEDNRKEIHASSTVTERKHLSLDEVRIREIIQEALAVYDADKTGLVDWALETAGGEVLSTRYDLNLFVI